MAEPSREDLALLETRRLAPEEWSRRFEIAEAGADGMTFEIAEPGDDGDEDLDAPRVDGETRLDGYNPYRAKDGKFAPGAHKAPAKAAAPKFNAAPHQQKIAKLKAEEADHRRASIAIRDQMAAAKRTAKAGTPKQRAEVKEQFAGMRSQRAELKAKATDAKVQRVAATKAMQDARKEHVAQRKAARDAAKADRAAKREAKDPPKPENPPERTTGAPTAQAVTAPTPAADPPPVVWEKKKNPKRVAAAEKAAAASVERRREIHSAVASNLPHELQSTWDKEGHKFMQQEAGRIRGEKDRINAASKLSEAFTEKYGSGSETSRGYEGDRYHRRAEIEAKHAESWADEQESKYYASMMRSGQRGSENDDGDVPF
jgi:hypothetical protein